MKTLLHLEQLESRCLLATCGADGTATLDGAGDLCIVGTPGNDVLQVSLTGTPDRLRVRINGAFQYVAGVTGVVVMRGGDGADTLQMTNVPKDARLYGEAGNDYISSYYGNDLLVGGTGNDRLLGHNGNDVLIGGDGADILSAGAGDDLLFGADATAGDDENDAVIAALLTDWADNGILDSFLISPNDDGIADTIHGDAGNDTGYFGLGDSGDAETVL